MNLIQLPAVEERVVDRGAHGDDVRAEESQQKIRRLCEVAGVLVGDVDGVERQPAADEYRDHRDQHAVRTSLALYLGLVARAPTETRQSRSESVNKQVKYR